jgi:hypothetical protein
MRNDLLMKKIIVFLLTFLFFMIGCKQEQLLSPSERVSKIDLQIAGLNAPGDSAHYEAWLKWLNKTNTGDVEIFENLGTMTNDNGMYVISEDINQGYIQGGLSVVVSVETDTASQPGPYRIIGADLQANYGFFSIGSNEVLDFDFKIATGYYFLDTPSENPPSQNPNSGIWFAKLDTTIKAVLDSLGNVIDYDTTIAIIQGLDLQDLTLPEIPSGWNYEGWVIFGSDTLSTGIFRKPTGADLGSDYNGPRPGYAFPGGDFIRNAPAGLTFPTDLSGREVLITLTPGYPSKANKPFSLTVFRTTVPANAQAMKTYGFDNVSETFPEGDLKVTVTLYK